MSNSSITADTRKRRHEEGHQHEPIPAKALHILYPSSEKFSRSDALESGQLETRRRPESALPTSSTPINKGTPLSSDAPPHVTLMFGPILLSRTESSGVLHDALLYPKRRVLNHTNESFSEKGQMLAPKPGMLSGRWTRHLDRLLPNDDIGIEKEAPMHSEPPGSPNPNHGPTRQPSRPRTST